MRRVMRLRLITRWNRVGCSLERNLIRGATQCRIPSGFSVCLEGHGDLAQMRREDRLAVPFETPVPPALVIVHEPHIFDDTRRRPCIGLRNLRARQFDMELVSEMWIRIEPACA